MKAYVINLRTADKRRESVKKQLEKEENIEYEFIPAINGNALSDTERAELFDITKAQYWYGRDIRAGEIGCTLSHQLCYRKLLETAGGGNVIIFEDDIYILSSIK